MIGEDADNDLPGEPETAGDGMRIYDADYPNRAAITESIADFGRNYLRIAMQPSPLFRRLEGSASAPKRMP